MNKKNLVFAIVMIALIGAAIAVYGYNMYRTSESSDEKESGIEYTDKDAFQMKDASGANPEGIRNVVEANNRLALDLYAELRQGGGNIFFSPWSISTVLAMAYEGARGNTGEQMLSVLHFPPNEDERRSAFALIFNEMNRKDKEYTLDSPSALWAQKDYRFLESYFDVMRRYYGGKVTNVDFEKDAEGSRNRINQWVEGKTNNKIKDLIPQGSIDEYTRLVLTNAIYFKGEWVKKFDEKNTQETEFRIGPGNTVMIPMMSSEGPESRFSYGETEDVQILELPYSGKELSMLILLPKSDDIEVLEGLLDIENLNDWRSSLQETEVDVYLPRFKLETEYFLVDTFVRLGMNDAFNPNSADFSGITGKKDLFISNIVHKAYVEVNEEGTEAAAATGLVFGTTSIQEKKIFKADHPFIFIIREKATGNILFMGRVVNPVAS